MSSIKKNFVYIGIYNMLAMLLPLVTSPILSRTLGAESLGIYGYVDAIAGIFLVFATTGVSRYGMREIAKVRDDLEKMSQAYSNILAINTGNILLVILIYAVFIFSWNSAYTAYFVIKLGILVAAIFDNAFLYCGIENMRPITIRDGAVKLTAFFMIVALVREPNDLGLYFGIMTISSLLPAVIGFCYARRFVNFVRPDWGECRRIYWSMVVLLIPMLASNLYQSIDRVMIGSLFGQADVGYYLCATKVLVPRSVIMALGTAICPNLAYLYAMGQLEIANRKFGKSLIISLIFAFAVTGITAVVAKDFAPMFWGEDFVVCAPLMIGIAITIPIWTVGEVLRSQYLLAKGRDNEYVSTFVLGVVVNGIVNYMLIPSYGASGAVVGTIVAELAMSLLQVYFVRDSLPIGDYFRQALPYLLFTVLTVLLVNEIASFIHASRLIRVVGMIILWGVLYCTITMLYEKFSSSSYVTDLLVMGKELIGKRLRR